MPREVELLGFYMPTLLPIFIVAFGLQWLLDSALARTGFYAHVWHPSLFRFSVFVCLFGAMGLALYSSETPPMNLKSMLRFLLTGAIFAIAVVVAIVLWRHYMYSPWTRDGRVKADSISLAPDVSGLVTEVPVKENQLVHAGDVVLRIDQERYKFALAQAEAAVAARKADFEIKRSEAARRASLSGIVISSENRESALSSATAAEALYQEAQASRDTARLNLERTEVKAPVDGYITNLDIHPGDYASAGRPLMAVLDSHSFRINGYFEETKLPHVKIGDKVRIRLMSGGPELSGHIDSLARGITDRDNPDGPRLLANVNPTFNWVRLAQRVPVRIAIDQVPDGVVLASGMTCTVIVSGHGDAGQ